MGTTRDPMFYAKLAKINEDFLELVTSCGSKQNNYYDFSQTCQDYIDMVKSLDKDYPDGLKVENTSTIAPTTTNIGDNGFQTTSNCNNFRSKATDNLNNGTADNDNNNGDDNEDDDEPLATNEPQAERYCEPDSIHSVQCKMYCKKDAGYVLKGVGTLFIKKLAGSDNHQVIIRAEPDLRRILLNFLLTSSLPVRRQAKTVQFVCPDNVETLDTLTVALKLKTETDAITLVEKLEKAKHSKS